MNTIIFEGNDKKIKSELIKYYSCDASVIIDRKSIKIYGNKNIVVFNEEYFDIQSENAVFAFYSDVENPEDFIIPKNYIGICGSENKSALEVFMANEISTVTYGFKNTDTITFSSMNENNCFISLQREVVNFAGKIIEPFEFEIKQAGFSKKTQLLISAIDILTKK